MTRGLGLLLCAAWALGCTAAEPAAKPGDATTGAQTVSDVAAADGSGADAAQETASPADAQGQDAGGTDAAGTSDAVAAPGDAVAAEDAVPTPVAKAMYGINLADWKLNPKQEDTRCVIKRLDNEMVIYVQAIHTKLNKGSHHLIVYKSNETKEKLDPFPCNPFTETLSGGNVPLMITQIVEEKLQLPPGVAFKLEPKQMIRLEAHYLNYFPTDITAHADIEFLTLQPKDLKHEADLLFYGTPDFWLPKGKTTSTPWLYLDVWPDTKIFALTGHTHKLGTNVQIALADDATKSAAPLIYPGDKTYDWQEPPVTAFDPPLAFGKKQGLQYRCTWYNDTDKNVGFGESASKEMCFFWAYYYPSKGYRMCINPGPQAKQEATKAGFDIGDQICCPDSEMCGLIKLYLANL